jgi:hypothetical protein
VRNLLDTGATLEVASPVGIPDEFDLVFKADGSVRPGRVIWRKETRIGVEFSIGKSTYPLWVRLKWGLLSIDLDQRQLPVRATI